MTHDPELTFVQPKPDLAVPLFDGGAWPLDDDGKAKAIGVPVGARDGAEGRYWRRRIKDGDVIKCRAPAPEKPVPAAKAKEAAKPAASSKKD